MGLPRSHIDFYTKYGIHLSSIGTAACWRVVPAQGCRGCPCCAGSQSGNGTVWTTFVNSHNNNQTSLKILNAFFVAACLYGLFDFQQAHCCQWLIYPEICRGLYDTISSHSWCIRFLFLLLFYFEIRCLKVPELVYAWFLSTEKKEKVLVHEWLDGLTR